MKNLILKTLPLTCALLVPQLGCATGDSAPDVAVDEAEVVAPVTTSPVNGALGVAPNAQIRITFRSPVDASSVNADHFRLVPVNRESWATPIYEADRIVLSLDASRRTVTITPTVALKNFYQVEVNGVHTDAGMVNHRFSFTALHNEATRVESLFDGEPSFTTSTQIDAQGRRVRELTVFVGDAPDGYQTFSYTPAGPAPTTETFFSAGPDGRIDTSDDVPSSQQTRLFDELGFPRRETVTDTGPDGVFGTGDDTIVTYNSYLRVGDTTWALLFAMSPGADGIWFNADDDAAQLERFQLDSAGRLKTQTVFVDRGPDGLWRTADDVVGSRNASVYAPRTIRGRSLDAGDDQRFGTPDDREYRTHSILNANGEPTGYFFSFTPGADGNWETFDDNNASHSTFAPSAKFPTLDTLFANQGPDGRWNTADDEVQIYSTFTYNTTTGAEVQRRSFNEPGPDGLWFTADDVLDSVITFYPRL